MISTLTKLSVVIVDDNEPVCRALSVSPIWASLPVRIRGAATSAEEAKALIRRVRPEILITDIRMPGSDGMELARFARTVLPECKVIFITAYDEFELAQKAVRVDAADFLLKPIRDEEVAGAVQRIAAELIDRQAKGREVELLRARYGAIEERFRSVESQAREKVISDLLRGTIVEKDTAHDRMSKLGMKLHRYRVLVAVNRARSESSLHWQTETQRRLDRERASRHWKELAFLLVTIVDGRGVIVVDFNEGCAERRTNEILQDLARIVVESTNRGTPSSDTADAAPLSQVVAFGASSPHSQPLSLRKAYGEALTAGEQEFFRPAINLHFYGDLPSASAFREDQLRRRAEKLVTSVSDWKDGSPWEPIEELVDRYFDELFKARGLGRVYSENTLRAFLESLKAITVASGRQPDLAALVTVPVSFLSFEEARRVVLRELRRALTAGQDSGGPLQRHHIELVNEFLESRYSEPIRLVDVAQAVGLSPSHLSRLIKATTGQTFTEVLTSLRLKVATRLLRETNAKVYEIADMVGMKNHAYFYQVFRKYTGVSPNELR